MTISYEVFMKHINYLYWAENYMLPFYAVMENGYIAHGMRCIEKVKKSHEIFIVASNFYMQFS